MNKVKVTTSINGEVTRVVEKELTDEELAEFQHRMRVMQEHKRRKHEESLERMRNIPPIHIEILKEANKVDRDVLIEKYPEYVDFINTIR